MTLKWTKDLSTSVDEIDNQHKELFKRINGLLDACNQGRGNEEVDKVIKFLEDYVIIHFGNEENYMIRYGYPEYPSHKAQHSRFMENLSEIKKRFETEGAGVHIVLPTTHLIVDWYINHIRKLDKVLGVFLNTKR